MTEFKNRHPRVELATVERSRVHLATALRNGTADVLIVTGDVPLPDNKVHPLWSERILVSLPEDHVLAAGTVVYWTDLRKDGMSRRRPVGESKTFSVTCDRRIDNENPALDGFLKLLAERYPSPLRD